MQLALRPYATAGVVVVAAGLIAVTPVVAPNIEQRALALASAGDVIDLLGPIDALGNTLTGAGESLVTSLADALPSLGDLSAAFDPTALASILDPGVIASFGAAFDPAEIGDIGTLTSAGLIPDLGEILTSLIP